MAGYFLSVQIGSKDWLPYYSQRFSTVEVNNTFYALPKATTTAVWNDLTPLDFNFTVKLSRYLTHMKHLKIDDNTKESVAKFYQNLEPIKDKIGATLIQLPPHLKRDDERLAVFLEAMLDYQQQTDLHSPLAVEFRHDSWHHAEVYKLLHSLDTAFVVYEAGAKSSSKVVTTDVAYLRFHGENYNYRSNYSDTQLKAWADFITDIKDEARQLYVYFNNDYDGVGAANAHTLISQLS